MNLCFWMPVLVMVWGVFALKADEPRVEKRVLFDVASAASWVTAEATVNSAPDFMQGADGNVLHWHVKVDHHGGEVKNPVGWPRASHGLSTEAQDWSEWDLFRLGAHPRTSRKDYPGAPMVMNIVQEDGEARSEHLHVFTGMKNDVPMELTVQVSELKAPKKVSALRFNIAEDQYRHGDELDFFLTEIALLRYAEPALLEFKPVNAVMFDDATMLPVSFDLLGVKAGEKSRVSLVLRRNGKTVAESKEELMRGHQRVLLKVSKAGLSPGTYELEGSAGDGFRTTAAVRVLSSPWQVKP